VSAAAAILLATIKVVQFGCVSGYDADRMLRAVYGDQPLRENPGVDPRSGHRVVVEHWQDQEEDRYVIVQRYDNGLVCFITSGAGQPGSGQPT